MPTTRGSGRKRLWRKHRKNCETVFIERKALLSALHCIALYGIVCAFLNLVDVDKWQWVATRSGTTLVRPWWSLFPLCRPQSQCHHFWAAAFRLPSYTFHTKEWKLAFYFDANPRPKSYQVHWKLNWSTFMSHFDQFTNSLGTSKSTSTVVISKPAEPTTRQKTTRFNHPFVSQS